MPAIIMKIAEQLAFKIILIVFTRCLLSVQGEFENQPETSVLA